MINIKSLDSKIKLYIEKNNVWTSDTIVLSTGHEITYRAEYHNTDDADIKYASKKPGFTLSRMEVFNGVSLYRFNDVFFDSIDLCQQAASLNIEDRIRTIFFNKDEVVYIESIINNQKILEDISDKVKYSSIDRTLEYAEIIQCMNELLKMEVSKHTSNILGFFRPDPKAKLQERIFLSLMSIYQREENSLVKNSISEVITSMGLY